MESLESNNSHGGEIRLDCNATTVHSESSKSLLKAEDSRQNESEVKIMKLGNILSVMNESKNMYVWDDGEVIASYDSRNSIPFELNNREVEMVDCENNEFHIYLECE